MGKTTFLAKLVFVSYFLMTAYDMIKDKKHTENLIKSYE